MNAPVAQTTSAAPQDVAERTPTYLVGVAYPKGVTLPAPLLAEMKRYADTTITQLKDAAAKVQPGQPGVPYDLSLEFRDVSGEHSPFFVIAADGSMYTGGEQGAPLLKRFVWDKQAGKLLGLKDVIVDSPDSWAALSTSVRNALTTQAQERLAAEKMPPQDVEATLKALAPAIEAGTQPQPEHYEAFEPMLDANGRVVGLTFIFPPYQVAGYADGTQRADVPVTVLAPFLQPGMQGFLAR